MSEFTFCGTWPDYNQRGQTNMKYNKRYYEFLTFLLQVILIVRKVHLLLAGVCSTMSLKMSLDSIDDAHKILYAPKYFFLYLFNWSFTP